MAYEVRDLSGSIFKNDRKEKETHPDFNGSCRIDGTDYWISMWSKQGRSGEFFSLAFKKKDGTTARPEPAAKDKSEINPEDMIPF